MKQIIILLLCLLPVSLWAQQTGNFDRSIVFMGSTRLVSVYVPENYDPEKQYPLYLGLHGFNQSTQAIRDALHPIAQSREAIIVCPSGNGNRHDDEFPAFDNGATITREIGLVHTTLDSALRWFSIDPAAVVLTGFSYGGRESLYFGLSNYFKFQGIIGLSPAVQSAADVNNNLPIPRPNPFAFTNQSKIPICICAGEQDDFFIEVIRSFSAKLEQAEGADTLLLNPAGHTLNYPEFSDDFNSCLDFIARNKVETSTSIGSGAIETAAIEMRIANSRLSIMASADVLNHIRIITLNGKQVYHTSATGPIDISTSTFPSGNYIVQIISSGTCQSSIQYLP